MRFGGTVGRTACLDGVGVGPAFFPTNANIPLLVITSLHQDHGAHEANDVNDSEPEQRGVQLAQIAISESRDLLFASWEVGCCWCTRACANDVVPVLISTALSIA